MTLRFYNSLTKKIEEFVPVKKGEAGMYSCGPTVYSSAQLGNFRTFLFSDTLKRVLKYNGYTVRHVMNITDVGHLTGDRDMGEDKLAKQSQIEGKTSWEIADFYTQEFLHDMAKLNILPPDIMPKATDHIAEQIEMIQRLEDKGYTYRTSDGIYFDTSKLSSYGQMATVDVSSLKEGARVEKNPEKKNPTDFALWKFSPAQSKREMEWPSPWGLGFPGWHIECSAMSVKYLGDLFDIHTGGVDLLNLHHTNELAQSQGAIGSTQANYWLHGEFLMLDSGRMGKSEGNSLHVGDIEKRGLDPLAFRYLVLTTHYRKQLKFSWESLESAQRGLNNLREAVLDWGETGEVLEIDKISEERFHEAINDDLDLPKALRVAWEVARSEMLPGVKRATLLRFDEVFGLRLGEIEEIGEDMGVPDIVEKMIQEREEARKRGDYAEADRLRGEILLEGYVVEDTPGGTKMKRKLSS